MQIAEIFTTLLDNGVLALTLPDPAEISPTLHEGGVLTLHEGEDGRLHPPHPDR
jgi:hypothetical protein